ncbi:uncharacterized protein SCHCODRAFT_02551748 [Schizophyllum commune H4-8]|uniref:Expressed protein n=1 Tax=Schizophyllum commune (strain H4-8 / FGSC 9210) TaxID=578458 RepID=D8QDL9_SCHCM|nr:uncharacterized protein SCHCODRAFT_02551748 [Schizophyllum commune H4-8]KAI5888669.1 hypothetical protein SCHCODRAFT_02551748 [Schizophyllum commune H4-8]
MLPLELLESCLDHLVDDKRSLAICARAHSSLLEMAQRRLFAELPVHFTYTDPLATQIPGMISDALKLSPHLGAYVQRCAITCDDDWAHLCAELIADVLPEILEHLPSLRSLSGYNVFLKQTEYTALYPALEHVLRLPTLTHLHLDTTCNFPFYLMRGQSLQHLTVIDSGQSQDTLEPREAASAVSSPIKLRTLKLGTTRLGLAQDRAVAWIQSGAFDFGGLQALQLDMGWMDESSAVLNILRPASKTLELLVLLPDYHQRFGETLEIFRMLAQLPFKMRRLRALVIYAVREGHRRVALRGPPFGDLDDALARKDAYPNLRDVVIITYPYTETRGRKTNLEGESWWAFSNAHRLLPKDSNEDTLWRAVFPKCAEAGLLHDFPSEEFTF